MPVEYAVPIVYTVPVALRPALTNTVITALLQTKPEPSWLSPPGEFYVLGDNRADSCDSRYWGPIRGSSIIGQAILVIWHHNHPDLHGL